MCGTFVEAAFEPIVRFSFKYIIDEAIVPRDYSYLMLILGTLGLGVVIYSFLCILGDLFWAKFGTRVINDIRQNLFDHTMMLSEDFFRRRNAGDILNCFLSDTANIEHSLVSVVPYAFIGTGTILISVIMLFSLHWQLAIFNMIGLAICFIIPRFFMKRAVQRGFLVRQKEGRIAGKLQKNLASHSVIRMFGLERTVSGDILKELKELLHLAVRANFLSYFIQRLPNVFFIVLALVILGFGSSLAYEGSITIGTLISYQVLSLGLSSSIANLSWITPCIVEGLAGFQRINNILDETPSILDAPGATDLPLLKDELGFQDVSFSYEKDRLTLRDVSFHIRKGSFAVFVGPSGSGKTSILNLLCRLYDPDSGTVFYDDTNIREVRQCSLRAQIGFVPQVVTLFDTTIRENIRFGNLTATDDDIRLAAEKADIHDFIMSLPSGYDTVIGEGGEGMSAGQRQRIALARALVRKPAVIILDEATSALDPIVEAGIFETLSRLAGESTVIAVTHRLNMALRADVIFVIDDGRIRSSGHHHELIDQCRLYARLWLDDRSDKGMGTPEDGT